MTAKAAKRARKPKENSGAASLIEALKFVSLAQQKEGVAPLTHCAISNGRIIAFDGVIAVGHPIEDDLHACPHTLRLLDALSKCGANLSITQLDSGRLSVKSDRFKAFVPCVEFEHLAAPQIEPDAPCAAINDELKAGFNAVAPLISETAPQAMKAGALLQANTIVGTNGHMLIEYWHGIDLPPGLLIPKATLTALIKTTKKLAKLGFSPNSVTFYFEDNSFIKSQLLSAGYPDYQTLFAFEKNLWPAPEGLFEGLDKIKSFAENDLVTFTADGLQVFDESRQNAGEYAVAGLQAGMTFNIEYLKLAQPFFKSAEFYPNRRQVYFEGNGARGLLMGINK